MLLSTTLTFLRASMHLEAGQVCAAGGARIWMIPELQKGAVIYGPLFIIKGPKVSKYFDF
jgi:hypothetical protein